MNYPSHHLNPWPFIEQKEKGGFIKLLNTLEPRYSIPSRPFFSKTIILGIYSQIKQGLLLELLKALGVSLTTDGWNSKATESYITTTAHYMTDDWELREKVLETVTLNEAHTAQNLADCLDSTAEK